MPAKAVKINKQCKFCNKTRSPKWWKCCSRHASEGGLDVLCQWCAEFYHPELKEKGGKVRGLEGPPVD